MSPRGLGGWRRRSLSGYFDRGGWGGKLGEGGKEGRGLVGRAIDRVAG